MSNARSPRDVCSITIGIAGLMLSLLPGVPTSYRRGLLLLGRPELAARGSELGRDPLPRRRPGRAPDACEIVAQLLEPAGLRDDGDRPLGLVLAGLGLLADQRLDVGVRDLDPELVGGRVEDEPRETDRALPRR